MSLLSFIFGRPCNIDNGHDFSTRAPSALDSYIVARQDYVEENRQYVCNVVDLYKLIGNDKRLLLRKHLNSKVLVLVLPRSFQSFEVRYAVISSGVLSTYPSKLMLLLPEGWLLYRALTPNVIYSVQSEKPYWAYLNEDKTLYTSTQTGLMQNVSFFIDALGLSQTSSPQSVSISDLLPENGQLPMYWYTLPFLLVNNRQVKRQRWNFIPLVTLSGAIAFFLMVGVSSWLSWKQTILEHDVQALRSQANEIFGVQQQLDERLEMIARYKGFMDKYPPQSDILLCVERDLSSLASLTRIQSVGALVTIEGEAENATDVLAKLSTSSHWSEVRFDKKVSSTKNGQSFSINMVFQQQKQAVTK